jgi:hypothetical protein
LAQLVTYGSTTHDAVLSDFGLHRGFRAAAGFAPLAAPVELEAASSGLRIAEAG